MLRSLPSQLRELLDADDPSLVRLFPPAYADDPQREAEYQGMVRGDLVARRREALDVVQATIDAERLDQEQLEAWMAAINDLRLVLGTKLQITEEMYEQAPPEGEPRASQFGLFVYLGWLQEQVVEALAQTLP